MDWLEIKGLNVRIGIELYSVESFVVVPVVVVAVVVVDYFR